MEFGLLFCDSFTELELISGQFSTFLLISKGFNIGTDINALSSWFDIEFISGHQYHTYLIGDQQRS